MVAINIDKLPMEALKGKVYGIAEGTYKFKKIKDLTPNIFDYVFLVENGTRGELVLYPLSSGRYENKPIPYVLSIMKKKMDINVYNDILNNCFIVLDKEDTFNKQFIYRYKGSACGTKDFKKPKGYVMMKGGYRYYKGVYYKYYFETHTHSAAESYCDFTSFTNWSYAYDKKLPRMFKETENTNDLELMKTTVGYEFLYDHKKGMFGVVTASFKDEDKINYGKAYWGDAAVRYLESNYLDSYIASKEAYDARKKTELEREAAYPCGWAYFSEKGKGNIKYKITCEIEKHKVTVVFSGFNKNDNVIDEVFVLPPTGNAIEENPNIKPAKALYLYSYFQQGVNFAYIKAEEDANTTFELYTSMDVLATIDSILNKSSKWINKTGINYYHRDRWGNEHKMQ